MAFFLIPLAALCLYGMKFSGKEFRTDYMSPQTTTAVNGIFTVLVFMCHIINTAAYQYGGLADKIFKDYINIGQLVVVTFFFFSGYGIAESLRSKPGYAKRMPYHRIFRVWLSFAAALVLTLAAGGAGSAKPPAEPAAAVSAPAEPTPEELRFIVRESGGKVCVFREGFQAQPAIVTEISVGDLPAADRALLEAGMEIAGREALLRLLEDLGS